MSSHPHLSQLNDKNYSKHIPTTIDLLVKDLLHIWGYIHSYVKDNNISSLNKVITIIESLFEPITLPFYKKYLDKPFLVENNVWLKQYFSFDLKWINQTGGYLFPLKLLVYEILKHSENLYVYYASHLVSGDLDGSLETFQSIVYPKMIHLPIPLSNNDISILKALRNICLFHKVKAYTGPNYDKIAEVSGLNTRTVIRRIKQLNFYQMYFPMKFIDMAKLGYETHLAFHQRPLPSQLAGNILFSIRINNQLISLVQIQYTDITQYRTLSQHTMKIIPLNERIQHFNLQELKKDRYFIFPPPVIYTSQKRPLVYPPMDLHHLLDIDQISFRPLSHADITILDYITNTGIVDVKLLAEHLSLSHSEVLLRLKEYENTNLLTKVYQYYNVGLDYGIHFLIESTDESLPIINDFLSFPKVDLFSGTTEKGTISCGHFRCNSNWFRDIIRYFQKMTITYPTTTIQYSIERPLRINWNISLKKTYRKPE